MSETHHWNPLGRVADLPYTPADEEDVLRMVRGSEGVQSAAVARFWLERQPGAFRVQRSYHDGGDAACSAWLRMSEPHGQDVDPVAAAAWAHAHANHPLRPGEHLALARFHVHPKNYQRPSPVMDLILWRMLGEIIRDGQLAWSFIVMRDDGFWNKHLIHCDMEPVEEAVTIDGHAYRLFARDWRTLPPTSWLTVKTDMMLTGESQGSDVARKEATARSEVAILTREEFDGSVRAGLRALRWPSRLASNPLQLSRRISSRVPRVSGSPSAGRR
ncbi:hypothetical protein ACIHCQ_34835 [Streptomyces sp. NPDC052236]|uniref:hypothetical protein n=1 Tax=Streptomyces sp. NPDC052236 TaxID=3365686 RepID=UPI0037CF5D2E